MFDLASSGGGFASTPAGYVSGIVMPAALVFMGWLGKRAVSRIDNRFIEIEKQNMAQSLAMTTNTQALAIIVERIAPMQTAIAQTMTNATSLSESVAVLKEKIASHEAWAQREHERVMKKMNL